MKGFNYFLCLLLLLVSYSSFAQEICDNGKDDDGDGLIDLQDPDCQCHFQVTGNILKNASFELHNNCPPTILMIMITGLQIFGNMVHIQMVTWRIIITISIVLKTLPR